MKEQVERIVAANGAVRPLSAIAGASPFKDRSRLVAFRSWRTFQRQIEVSGVSVTVWGELDDLIEHEDGRVSPWDFKTKGDEPDDAYGKKWYGDQLDMYHLLLEGQGLQCTGIGYLSYGWPESINEDDLVVFGWKNIVLETDPSRSVDLLDGAVKCLSGAKPAPGLNFWSGKATPCEWCSFATERQMELEADSKVSKTKAARK